MTTKKNNVGFQTLALTDIHESTTNPRRTFDESKLAELAESLRTQGLIQPITVRPNSEGYEIVAGARRFRAARITAPQLRVLLRALIHIDPYQFTDDVAAYFVADENNKQTAEEVLTAVVDGLEDKKLTGFALRLVLTTHAGIPSETEIDSLTEAAQVFSAPQPKKREAKKKVATKKAAKKPVPAKSKSAKRKTTTKRLAA